jgi:hypothetical protein
MHRKQCDQVPTASASVPLAPVLMRDRPHDRLFQRSVAKVTVGAVGPNAAHFLQAMNFVSRSLLTQRSDDAQKGHGCNGPESGIPGVRSETGFSPSFPAIQLAQVLVAR